MGEKKRGCTPAWAAAASSEYTIPDLPAWMSGSNVNGRRPLIDAARRKGDAPPTPPKRSTPAARQRKRYQLKQKIGGPTPVTHYIDAGRSTAPLLPWSQPPTSPQPANAAAAAAPAAATAVAAASDTGEADE